MSLKYYLFCRKYYQNLINNINDIIQNYEEMTNQYYIHIDAIIKENNTQNLSLLDKEKKFYVEEKKRITNLKKECNQKIYDLCFHKIEEDFIDIGPDNCKCIKYCKICETTFE
jgi:hypothetical protein